jgi:predicted phosphodiesterase
MTRRDFLAASGALVATRWIPLDLAPAKPIRFAVITDLHHGLAPDAMVRLRAFADAVRRERHLDAVLQLGDFCYSQPDSKECAELFKNLPYRKIHVLGNHDMDKVTKDQAVAYFGMKSRYGSHVIGGYRFVVLDLNHFRKDGKLVSYANGNYFTDNAACNYADPEQLEWLAKELRSSREPVILLSHQPLGFAEPGQSMPAEQIEVLDVVSAAAKANPRGAVRVCLFGHLHVDRLERASDLPCLCVNSASYFWSSGMHPYTKPLFAFMEINRDGVLKVEGISGEFVHAPPKTSDTVIGRSASISSREIPVR